MNQDVAIAVLAGGQSRRMGRDKAEIELEGATLLERIAYVANLVAPTAVVGRQRPDDFQFESIPFLEDDEPGLGPIGGLRTALVHFETPVILIGCDMPLMQPDSIRWLCETFERNTSRHGLATTREGEVEPLFSVYRPRCVEPIDEMVEDGQRAVRRLIDRGEFERVEAPTDVAPTLRNINTPADLKELERML